MLATVLGACGVQNSETNERGHADADGSPVEGGSITYGIESETTGGWCLPDAQLAAAGTEVAQAIYETLTVPNARGQFVPYLAKSVDHNRDYTQWTITLRGGISFHDGEPLDAAAVVRNLEAYRQGPLWRAAFGDIADVRAVDNLTVLVTTRVPWVEFPAALWGTGRLGIAAPAQLDDLNCATNLIGTGPFSLKSWVPDDSLVVTKNVHYWQKDKSGKALPYLDQITFRPQEDSSQRVNGLKGGDLDLVQVADGQQIAGLRDDARSGLVNLLVSGRDAEVDHTMLNTARPPFDRKSCRLAVAYAIDTESLRESTGAGTRVATQPFAPRTSGYQRNPGYPGFNSEDAERFLNDCTGELGAGELRFTLDSTPDPPVQALGNAVKDQLAKVGIRVELAAPTNQSAYIDLAIRGEFQAMLWRNFPSVDPDTLYPWWHSTAIDPGTGATVRNLANLSSIQDPVIDQSLEHGRSEADPAKRRRLYEAIGRRFGEEAYNIWAWYVDWAFAARPRLQGLQGPELPTGERRGLPITSVQPVLGLWLRR
ncbi:MAG TPA: ABC transporter substrate-binding protein [Acidimicrobiia bacterium]|nr:ABC transporter substrate-binding protein [Acidimicrobiia bacterium]